MSVNSRTFNASPEAIAAWNPFGVGPGALSSVGPPIGTDSKTGAVVCLHPWGLMEEGEIECTICLASGKKRSGKTTLLKSVTARLNLWQAGVNRETGFPLDMTTRIHDRKREGKEGEYAPLSEFLGSESVVISQARINALSADMGFTLSDLVEISLNLCRLANDNKPLDDVRRQVLRLAVRKMYDRARKISSIETLDLIVRSLTLDDLNGFYEESDQRVLDTFGNELHADPGLDKFIRGLLGKSARLTEANLNWATNGVSDLLDRILNGDYGESFGGKRSLGDLLTAHTATLDWSGTSLPAMVVFEDLMWRAQERASVTNDVRLMPAISVRDELATAFSIPGYLPALDSYVRKARAYRTFEMFGLQHTTDLEKYGGEGSETARLAKNIKLGIGFHFIARQPQDDDVLHDIKQMTRMSDEEVQGTTKYPRGRHAVVIQGRPAIIFDHVLTDVELPLIKSDSASRSMVGHVPIMTVKQLRRRAMEAGIKTLGEE